MLLPPRPSVCSNGLKGKCFCLFQPWQMNNAGNTTDTYVHMAMAQPDWKFEPIFK